MATDNSNLPPEGWGERFGNPTYTVHGPSWDVKPPEKEGYYPHFIGRHGTAYTTWSYRPTHDYEPGDAFHAMHTDPLCRVCGEAKNGKVHGTEVHT